jgi:hypothetical protein
VVINHQQFLLEFTHHPVRSPKDASRYFIDVAATPPRRGGEKLSQLPACVTVSCELEYEGVSMHHPPSTILQLLREYRFDTVIPIVAQTLRDAAAESPQRLTEVAHDIVRWQGILPNTSRQ